MQLFLWLIFLAIDFFVLKLSYDTLKFIVLLTATYIQAVDYVILFVLYKEANLFSNLKKHFERDDIKISNYNISNDISQKRNKNRNKNKIK